MERELRQSFDAGAALEIRNLDELVFEVGTGAEMCTIDLVGKTCLCREFQMRQIPCAHASRAVCSKGISLYDLCSCYYTTECWQASYTELLYPIGMESDWIVPDAISSINILPPNIRIAPGCPPTQCRRSRTEWSTSTRKCGQCGGSGHNRQTCRNSTRRSNTRT
ncbi:uncharacterized protein LOC111376834 [Olea europaea var. sylvestris]|uniref:uncharacterized protein LOC111376834 n=1 Tax=Olea europaea var. sylvestris TaxID=158386 RepID=UPI000C1D1E76|nr:uncharacterized protein LOC111376834 [Olea europaea var. sylvestris]